MADVRCGDDPRLMPEWVEEELAREQRDGGRDSTATLVGWLDVEDPDGARVRTLVYRRHSPRWEFGKGREVPERNETRFRTHSIEPDGSRGSSMGGAV